MITRLKSLAFFTLSVVAATLSLHAQEPQPPADPVVMTIEGEPVSAREYRLVMERQIPVVYAYFKRTQNLEDHAGYWSEKTDAETPLSHLRDIVKIELVRIKTEQAFAKERRLVKETTYADFLRDFTAENTRRGEAHAKGQVIYGPPQYREATYYYIRIADLSYKLRQSIATELAPSISDAAIAQFYEANKGEKPLAEVQLKIRALLAEKAADQQIAGRVAFAQVDINQAALKAVVPRVDRAQEPVAQ